MAADVESKFAKEQKVWVKRAMKGRPLYFGLQAKAAKSGKFLLSKKPGEVKPNNVKDLKVYDGKNAEKENTIPGGASMGVAAGENGTLTLYFERGKALPVAEKFVKYFVTRLLKCKMVKKVVIAETDQLPAVPDTSDQDNFQPTEQTVRDRATGLLQRMQSLGGNQGRLGELIKRSLVSAGNDAAASDDTLDDVEFLLSGYERLAALDRLLGETAQEPGVAAEVVTSIRTKRLEVARQQLDSGRADDADENLDVAEQSIANLRKDAGIAESSNSGNVTRGNSDPIAESPVSAPPERQDSFAVKLTAAINRLSPNIKQAVASYPDRKSEILNFVDRFQTLLATGDSKQTQATLLQLTALLKTFELTEQSKAGDLNGVGKIWQDVRKMISTDLKEFEQALLSNADIKADPRFRFVKAAAAEVSNMLPRANAVNAAVASGDAAQIRAAIETYRSELSRASAFESVETFALSALNTKLTTRESLFSAIDEMESMLANAV